VDSTICMDNVLVATSVWKRREDLKAKRNALFKKYAEHPYYVRLALEIKALDDEIADCTRKIEEEVRARQ
jgi:hypothetical protein